MVRDGTAWRGLSPRRIFGFASNQAFVFFLFYLGVNRAVGEGATVFGRADLLLTLLFMVVGFVILVGLPASARTRAFLRPLLYVYAVLAAAGSLLSALVPGAAMPLLICEGALTGLPVSFLLAAWGRTFGRVSTSVSVPEVFLGAMVAAMVCLAFALASASDVALLAFRLLPLASVVNIDVPADDVASKISAIQDRQDDARLLSSKVLAGTVMFGVAAGLVETVGSLPGDAAVPYCSMSFVLLVAFLIGSLSLLLAGGSNQGSSLNKSYRLAVFLMMMGVLLVPLPQLAESILPGEAVVLAGYLGLGASLISLFLVMARITAQDAAHAFALGFLALFGGEILGVVAANVLGATLGAVQGQAVNAVLAGVAVLLSYVFLFTERDFDALTQIATVNDAFEGACAQMVERYRLSNREAEILPFAVRGRTSERIAQELVITKSTVDTHIRRIYAKCGVHSRQELIDLFEGMAR